MLLGTYFDGKTAAAHSVNVELTDKGILMGSRDGASRLFSAAQITLEERQRGRSCKINLPDGALLELPDSSELQTYLEQQGFNESLIEKAQNSWRWVGAATASLLAMLAFAYFVMIPWGSKYVVAVIPHTADQALGDQAWQMFEGRMFTPSELPAQRIRELQALFDGAAKKAGMPLSKKVELRASSLGPNAMALPGGQVVVTDALVKLAKSDDALLGVFLHELGHLRARHGMRNVVQTAAVTALLSVWFGDVSTLVSYLPAALLESKYSRDLEVEADDFALAGLQRLGIKGLPTAELFEAIELNAGGTNSKDWFASHPNTADRIAKFRALK